MLMCLFDLRSISLIDGPLLYAKIHELPVISAFWLPLCLKCFLIISWLVLFLSLFQLKNYGSWFLFGFILLVKYLVI